MECNKDEAERAKDIAEQLFCEKDLMGAQKFAFKAQNLYPQLDGLAQMMAALEVHIAAENKINGDMDWYGILCVNQFADEATVRKQYKKLALLLHPDKNKFFGADHAFKLLSEAWSVLSDRVERLSYDEKRKGFQQRPREPQEPASTTCPYNNLWSVNNGLYNFNFFNNPFPFHMPWPTPPPQRTDTFWTACPFCMTQYEYHRVHENQNLFCPNCQGVFYVACNMSFQWSSNPQFSQGQQNYQKRTATFLTACPLCEMQYEYHGAYDNQTMVCPNCKSFTCVVETTAKTMSETNHLFQRSSNPQPSQGQQQYEYPENILDCLSFLQDGI